jgi:hypothetical protein
MDVTQEIEEALSSLICGIQSQKGFASVGREVKDFRKRARSVIPRGPASKSPRMDFVLFSMRLLDHTSS